jgi:hypothetical protein
MKNLTNLTNKTMTITNKTMTKIKSKLMIDYDDNNSYLDFISENDVKYYIKSTKKCKNDYIITFIIKDTVKPVSIQQKLKDNVFRSWEYSEKLAESLGILIEVFQTCFELTLKSKYWLAIDIIEKEIQEHITNSYQNGWITNEEFDKRLSQFEDDDITHTIENIQYMIEKEYGENATLAEIRQDSEYYYNLLIASTYLKTKHNL